MTPLHYRADIDGLRAVAVLGVVIYHAFPETLPGGFVGVDIFFVISGYLISGILYKGLRANGGEGGFSFREFYARRIRRLFPALITVQLLCLGYGYMVLLSDEYRQMGKHVAAGTLFIQNMVFWQESGYWDVASTLKPLLHLWSLAVEEQFYIIFPLLLLLIWKRKWPMVPLLWILLTASLIANLIMSYQSRETDFYITTYRAWEFLGGSLLAWWHYGKNHEEEVPYENILSIVGVILLTASMILLKEKEPYPGWRAILPVAGSVMLIAAGKKTLVNKWILSNPVVVWIGLISYPLYLFHWPALSFVHIVKGERPADVYIAGALVVAFLLTMATYYLVEKPIRFSKSKSIVTLLVAAFLITGSIGLLVQIKVIKPHCDSNPDKIEKIETAIQDNYKNIFSGYQRIRPEGSLILIHTTGGKNLKTIFFGDSNMEQYAPRIRELIKDNELNDHGAIFVSQGGVPPITGVSAKNRKDCSEMAPLFYKVINEHKSIKNITIAALWPSYFSEKSEHDVDGVSMNTEKGKIIALNNIGSFIKELTKMGKKVTLLLSTPNDERLDPKKMYQRTLFGVSFEKNPKISLVDYQKSVQNINSMIKMIAEKNGAIVIDPVPSLATNGFLMKEHNNQYIYFDAAHIRPSYMRKHIHYIDGIAAP